MNGRAKSGGEEGKNGEWYDGGQFLPASAYTIKGENKVAKSEWKPRKMEVEPYKWEVQPTETARPIYCHFGVGLVRDRKTNMASEWKAYQDNARGAWGYSFAELAEMWNAGQRWVEPKT